MTTNKTTMPEPVAFLNPYGGVLTALTTGLERETFAIKLITTDQAEAYKDACVREALEWQPIETSPRVAGGQVIILKDCGIGTRLVEALERVMYCNEVGFLPESVQQAVSDALATHRKGEVWMP